MECGICLSDCLPETDMHYTECLHSMCFDCFKKLKNDSCPFCRQAIYLPTTFINNEDDETDDFFIPEIPRQRNRSRKQNKKNRRMKLLNDILDTYSQSNLQPTVNYDMLPNRNIRLSRLIRLNS